MAEQRGALSFPTGEMISGKPTNLVGLESKDSENYKATQEDLLRGLEQRYAQPNWFNIAAGFAKPQLGGFTASLGSAAGAYGEQQEKQRDLQIPIFKIRSELAAYDMALKQKAMAAAISEQAFKEGRGLTPNEIGRSVALTQGPSEGAVAGQQAATNVANNMRADLEQGMNWITFKAKYPDELLKNITTLMSRYPELKLPSDTPPEILNKFKPLNTPTPDSPATVTPASPANASVVKPESNVNNRKTVEGIPQEEWDKMTYSEQQKYLEADTGRKIDRKNILTADLGKSSSLAVPVYEQAKNLYEIASDPLLAPAFALGEKGNPLAILVKALETQTLSSTLAAMREQIQNVRFGSQEEKNKALTKFKLFESQLIDFRLRITAAYPNQTDYRTEIENISVPGVKNTQDAFLRGITRIASDNLSRAELSSAFQTYVGAGKDPTKWENSDEYNQVMENLSKRNSSILKNEARRGVPDFMARGLDGMFKPKKQDKEKKPSTPNAKPRSAMGDAIRKELADRAEKEAKEAKPVP
jgi:hypothetical protein